MTRPNPMITRSGRPLHWRATEGLGGVWWPENGVPGMLSGNLWWERVGLSRATKEEAEKFASDIALQRAGEL